MVRTAARPTSRFMLFNYRCNTKALPAVTHYDHSARVQHVSAETGLLYGLLLETRGARRAAAVLNTSFNGPGTPIIDTRRGTPSRRPRPSA
jgi:carbamoyltransferase